MNEDQIVASPGGLGGGMLANPQGSVAQAVQGGLGRVGSPAPEQQGYARNSSLQLFELANAEKEKAKQMQFENEAMKAKAQQMDLGNEKQALLDNQILKQLQAGKIDEVTAHKIFQDSSVSDATKQKIADVFYPVQATNTDYAQQGPQEPDARYDTIDEQKQAQLDAQSIAAGRAGDRNINWQ